MKFKFVAIFSIIVFCFVNSFAYERMVEIEVSTEETDISINAEAFPVKVKLTNKSKVSLNTKGLGNIYFSFSKCLTFEICGMKNDIYVAWNLIPKKFLKENESINFEVDLMELYWMEGTSSSMDFKFPRNFKTVVPSTNIYFNASIYITKFHKISDKLKAKFPPSKRFTSNTITVVMNY